MRFEIRGHRFKVAEVMKGSTGLRLRSRLRHLPQVGPEGGADARLTSISGAAQQKESNS